MAIPNPSTTNPIQYEEFKVWIKGIGIPIPGGDLWISGFLGTSGVVGTVSDTTVLAGTPGYSYRVWMLTIAPNYNVTGNGYVLLKRASSINYYGTGAFGAGRGFEIAIPGGFLLSVMENIVLRYAASVASQGLFYTVTYTLEAP